MFIIKISTDNEAFQDGNMSGEIVRILRDLCAKIEYGEQEILECNYPLFDANGNRVGTALDVE